MDSPDVSEPRLSVVVPVRDGVRTLPLALEGLRGSSYPPMEVIVVDDGSEDGSYKAACAAPGVRALRSGGRLGAAAARNMGSAEARGEILVFVDADVVVHADALARIAAHFDADPGLSALMGAYDDSPPGPGLVARFRNLLHAYFHRRGAGEASTFWTGLGAVRPEAFQAVGGFAPRDTLEDVEFGLRLTASGRRIVLDPQIQGTHLKAWTLWSMVRTDIFLRGAPWVELALRHGGLRDELNTSHAQRASVAAVGVLVLSAAGAVAGVLLGLPGGVTAGLVVLAVGSWGLHTWLNRDLLGFLAARLGWRGRVAGSPLLLLYHFCCGCAVVLGLGRHLAGFGRARPDAA